MVTVYGHTYLLTLAWGRSMGHGYVYGYEHVRTAKGDLHMVELCTAAILVNPAAQPLVETVFTA